MNRIRPLLSELVAPAQASFIPGRQSSDNILVALELIHTIKRCKSRNGLLAIKIDLEKAYDRISWDFLRETLLAFGFSQKWVKLIMLYRGRTQLVT